jgi:DNA-binding CsgD family transcriptional regulator/tetratricopeptide (TPR) repeat protein
VRSATAHGVDTVGTLSPLAAALGVRQRSGRAATSAARDVLAGGALGDAAADLVDACLGSLDALTGRAPLVVAVDDFHWAARVDVAITDALARRAGALPLCLVVALRPAPRSRECARFVEDLTRAGAPRLALEPLADDDALRIVASVTGTTPGADLRDAAHRMGGNPFHLRALGELASRDGAPRSIAGPDDVMQRWLAALEPDVVDVVRGAAVLGDVVAIRELATMRNERAGTLLPLVERCHRSGVLRRNRDHVRFAHDLVRKAVYRDIEPKERRTRHEDAARALRELAAAPERVAWHVASAASSADPTAARRLTRTARAAMETAPGAAAILGRRAVAVATGDDPDARAVLVEALARCGRADDALDAAREATATNIALRVAHAYAALQSRRPVDADAAAAIGAALNAGGAARPMLLAQVATLRVLRGDFLGAQDAAERVPDDTGDATVHAQVVRAWLAGVDGRLDDAITLATAAIDAAGEGTTAQWRAWFFLGLLLLDADRLAEAARTFATAIEDAGGTERWLVPLMRHGAGASAFLAGDWDRALVELAAGTAHAADIGAVTGEPASRGLLAAITLAQDDVDAARRHLAAADDALARGAAPVRSDWLAWARARVTDHDDGTAGALGVLAAAWDADVERGVRNGSRTYGPTLVRLAVAASDAARAEAVTRELERQAAASTLDGVRGAALRARALVDGDVGTAMDAIAAYGRAPRPYERALATLDAMDVCARAGHPNLAGDCFEDAANELAALGATGDLRAAHASARALGLRVQVPPVADVRGWASLTGTEREIAQLAAGGASNRSIGERLALPTRIVEQVLARTCTKLAVNGRVELAARTPRP